MRAYLWFVTHHRPVDVVKVHWWYAMYLTVCRVTGHREQSSVARLLGICDRCMR